MTLSCHFPSLPWYVLDPRPRIHWYPLRLNISSINFSVVIQIAAPSCTRPPALVAAASRATRGKQGSTFEHVFATTPNPPGIVCQATIFWLVAAGVIEKILTYPSEESLSAGCAGGALQSHLDSLASFEHLPTHLRPRG